MFLGPLLGGWLVSTPHEGLFGNYPYALPNIVIAVFIALIALGVAFFLDETLERSPEDQATFSSLWQRIKAISHLPGRKKIEYSPIQGESSPLVAEDVDGMTEPMEVVEPSSIPEQIPFNKIWTAQVMCTLIAQFVISAHNTSFQILWVTFLSTPVDRQDSYHRTIIHFGGGVGLMPKDIGLVMSALNGVGFLLQLVAYPWFNDRWNTIEIWHVTLMIFPFAYFFGPFPALVASWMSEKTSGTPPAVWITMAGVLTLNIIARTGSMPAMTILVNDCVPGPTARATINMAAMTSGQLSKTIFPFLIMAIYGWGLQRNVVGLAFWVMTALAVVGIIASRWVHGNPSSSKAPVGVPVAV